MKIVYCIPSLHNSGGMERVLTVKANYLTDVFGWEIVIVTTSQKNRPPFYTLSPKVKHIDLGIDYEAIMAMPLHKRILARLKASPEHQKKLSNLLLRERPDITVSMFTHEMSFLPDIEDGSRKVLELHFSKSFRTLDAISNNASRLIRTINSLLDRRERKQIGKYDKFVVLSHQDAEDWRSDVDNVSVISNPASFAPLESECTDYSAKKALAIGRLCPQKGFDLLIEAWSKIPSDSRDGWTLDIVGWGPDINKLEEQIAKHGLCNEIHILPPVKDVKKLYQQHSIFCFPSRYEGFGLSLMEAMSHGLACVATDCPCGPGELINTPEVGILVNTETIDEIATGLKRLMESEDIRRNIGQAAYRSIQDRFALPIIMGKWRNLFETL